MYRACSQCLEIKRYYINHVETVACPPSVGNLNVKVWRPCLLSIYKRSLRYFSLLRVVRVVIVWYFVSFSILYFL